MAENILAAACENESRNAAKRMRLEAFHVGAPPQHQLWCSEKSLDLLSPTPGRADRLGQAVRLWRRPEGAVVPQPLRLLAGCISLLHPGRHPLHQRSWNQLHLPWLPWAGRRHAAPGVPDRWNLTEQR